MSLTRPNFATVQEYGRRFTDPGYWRPYVETVCARHDIPLRSLRAGLAGTNPVFVIGDDGPGCVVKFFETKFFGGAASFALEKAIYALVANAPHLPAPALITYGHLYEDGDWPYIITTVIPGASLGEVIDQVSPEDQQALALFLGRLLRQLHDLPVTDSPVLQQSRAQFTQFIAGQRTRCIETHQKWQSLPAQLIAQIEEYLLPPDQLLECSTGWRLTHCDLNADHVLGEFVEGHWRPNGIIDFGDARVGDRLYELVALHLGLFHSDRHLLRLFLETYGFDDGLRTRFVERAMTYTLLHEFNVLEDVGTRVVQQMTNLDELAYVLWNIKEL